MALPVPGDDSRGLLSFRLFGFPVDIHASFLVIAFLFGASGQGIDAALVWVAVVTVSVLAHELGHAFVAAPAGGEPRIDLYAMAGLTRWNPGRAGRGRIVAVSLAGPAAGVAFGLGLYALDSVVEPARGTLLEYAFDAALFANLGWGLLNLLPMLPLDGGQVMRALLPAKDDLERVRRAAAVSLVVVAAVAGAAFAYGLVIAGVFVLFFGLGNAQTLLAIRRAKTGGGDEDRLVQADVLLAAGRPDEATRLVRGIHHPFAQAVAAAALLRQGKARVALHMLLDAGIPVDPTFEAALLLANGQEQLARERLAVSLREGPSDFAVRELTVLLLSRGDDLDEWLAPATGRALNGALVALFHAGEFARAAALGDRALATGAEDPGVAYNTACAWARAGDRHRALRALDHAALLGWTDTATLDEDADLAPLRDLPGYAAVRERIGLGESPSRG